MDDYDEEELHEGNFEVVQETSNDTTEEVVPQIPSEDAIHAYVHHQRVKLVKHMTKGNKFPEAPQEQAVFLAALKDMDNSAHARKRLQAESDTGNVTAGAAAIIANLLTAMGNNGKKSNSPAVVIARPAPKLGADVPPPTLLEGETATTLPQQSYATFMSMHASDKDATPN